MTVPLLHRQVERLSDRELFVDALLGLRSFAERVGRTLEGVANPSSSSSRRAERFVDERGDASIMVLLGALSVARKFLTELDGWRPKPPAPLPRQAVERTEGLLR